MKIHDGQAVIFSIKCFAAAMLAYYVALSIGLPRPYWAVTTSYIIAQPLAGAVLSKALFRMIGTIVGAAVAVVLVPTFVNAPAVLIVALGLWLSVCVYISLFDRTPRAYIFLLAGYTASIIGIPSVEAPGAIFNTAILRVQEITIGILCASLIHGLVFPRTITAQLLQRVEAVLADARSWSQASLAGLYDAALNSKRRRVALDVLDLHMLSIHLPFDTARLLPRVRTVRAFQHQVRCCSRSPARWRIGLSSCGPATAACRRRSRHCSSAPMRGSAKGSNVRIAESPPKRCWQKPHRWSRSRLSAAVPICCGAICSSSTCSPGSAN
jgi:uncharacterized membrane protein YccC